MVLIVPGALPDKPAMEATLMMRPLRRGIIDARPTRGNKQKDRDRREPPEEPKKRGLFGFLADLQARAEEMRRQAERKGGK
jgi:hypothetical protein